MSAYDEILSSSSIINILEYYGLKINKNKCTCPFHNDSHPSMMVNTNKGIAKCFVCGSGGNAISFIQKYENEINHNSINTTEAMKKAIDIQHLNIVISENKNIPLTKEQSKQKILSNILKDSITICENNLKIKNIDSERTINYLKGRNLSIQTINNFHIGFNPRYNNITNELLKKYQLKDLVEIGITKETKNGYIDIFSNRIMIPIVDEFGNPVGFGARVLDNNSKPKYINTMATSIFNKSELLFNYHKAKSFARDYEIIVVEGYMDVISANDIGFSNAVGMMGTALTKEQIELLKKLKCEVTLSLDNDEAGKNAMIRIIPELLNEGLEVNVLDISKLENKYKDFGDLQVAKIKKENIYKTKVSAFIFLLKYKYLQDKELNVDNIYNIYREMQKEKLIKDTKDVIRFKEYMINNTKFTGEEIENIIMPKKVEQSRLERYKGIYFYYFIMNHLKKYATDNQDRILQKYLETNVLSEKTIEETLNNEKYLKDVENTIDIKRYINEYIYASDEYIKFKNDKTFILENLLNNVKSYDSEGNVVNIKLTIKQKEIVLKQYDESFDSSIKEMIENNPDEYEELFIANNSTQFSRLFPKTYVETIREQSVERFKNENVMEAVRYALAYPEDMKTALSDKYVNNDKYKTLLVFNNNKNILELSSENIIKEQEEKEIQKGKAKEKIEEKQQNTEVEKNKKDKNMSIFVKLSGNEKESYKGMYLPINNGIQVFIPKQLYKKDNDKLQILNFKSNSANMSEYVIDEEQKTKKWMSRLTLDQFYHKYFNLYEISMEKEVMPNASY